MTDAEKMAELTELVRRVPVMPCGWIEPSWYERRIAILAPPPDPDALLDTICDVWWVGKAGTDRIAVGNGKRWLLTCGTHGGDAIVRGMRAVAAWVEADRVKVRHAALTEAALVVEREHLPKRYILALRDGVGVS